jgi:hypothetical protein
MKTYSPKRTPTIFAHYFPKGAAIPAKHYLIIDELNNVSILSKAEFESQYRDNEKTTVPVKARKTSGSVSSMLLSFIEKRDPGTGLTAKEIVSFSEFSGYSPTTIAARLSELARDGYLETHPNAFPSRYRLIQKES